jgi:transposase-like protein
MFFCPRCGNDHGYEITARHLYECTQCKKQTSVMAGTLFHGSKITLIQWFWAIYFLGSDKGSISALRLSKLIEVDDALVGGKQKGKRGRGSAGKTDVVIAYESNGKTAGFIAMQAVDSVCHLSVDKFVRKHLKRGQKVHSDALSALNIIDQTQDYEARVTSSYLFDEWLPGYT